MKIPKTTAAFNGEGAGITPEPARKGLPHAHRVPLRAEKRGKTGVAGTLESPKIHSGGGGRRRGPALIEMEQKSFRFTHEFFQK